MSPDNESSDPDPPVETADAEQFDSALDVGVADDDAIDNPNSDTWRSLEELPSRDGKLRSRASAPYRSRQAA